MLTILLPLALGILVALLLLPLMRRQYRQIENDQNGLANRVNIILLALVEVVLLFGGIFLVLYLFREQRAEDKVMPLLLYEAPSLGFFLFYLARYIIPSRLRAEKRKLGR